MFGNRLSKLKKRVQRCCINKKMKTLKDKDCRTCNFFREYQDKNKVGGVCYFSIPNLIKEDYIACNKHEESKQ